MALHETVKAAPWTAPVRMEFELASVPEPMTDVERALPLHTRIARSTFARRLMVVAILGIAWEIYATVRQCPYQRPDIDT